MFVLVVVVRPPVVLLAALLPVALFLEPVRVTLYFGQINLLLMGLVVADCLVRKPKWPRRALVGLAAAVKLTPAAYVLFFLLRGDRRAAATAVTCRSPECWPGWGSNGAHCGRVVLGMSVLAAGGVLLFVLSPHWWGLPVVGDAYTYFRAGCARGRRVPVSRPSAPWGGRTRPPSRRCVAR